MLPEAGATELIFLAAIALIVVGPKDLPVLMRKVGQWVAKMRGLAAEFRSSFDELARQSELDELRKEVEALRNSRLADPLTNLHPTFDEVSAGLDPSGFAISPDPHPVDISDPHVFERHEPVQPVTVEQIKPAKPARAPRKPKAAATQAADAAEAKPGSARPKAAAKTAATKTTAAKTAATKTAEVKPRARRAASAAAETEG